MLAAYRFRSLSRSGVLAAIVVGTTCVTAGWDWAGLLIAFFVTSTALSRLGHERKERLASGVVTKGTVRDATQVMANGGAFALCALGSLFRPTPHWYPVAAGALAAATADTWATEVGLLVGRTPRSILSWRPVAPGTSGAVTAAGTVAAIAGAAFLAGTARVVGWSGAVAAGALMGGTIGAMADSLLGATAQERRWCERCHIRTERDVHVCGAPTAHAGGCAWLDNDGVNAVSTVVGALTSAVVAWALPRIGT